MSQFPSGGFECAQLLCKLLPRPGIGRRGCLPGLLEASTYVLQLLMEKLQPGDRWRIRIPYEGPATGHRLGDLHKRPHSDRMNCGALAHKAAQDRYMHEEHIGLTQGKENTVLSSQGCPHNADAHAHPAHPVCL